MIGRRRRLALTVGADLAGEDAVCVGGESATEAANDPGQQCLTDKAAFAADHAAAHARLSGKGDKPLDLAHRDAAARLRAGHAHQFDVRSEERRVGKEGVSTGRYRWS